MHKVRRLLQAARVRRVLGGLYLHLPHDNCSATGPDTAALLAFEQNAT